MLKSARALSAILCVLATAFHARNATAEVSNSYALQITETHIDFSITVNGIPKIHRSGASLAAVPYFLEDLLHDGRNDVAINLRATDPAATLVMVLSAPAADPSQDGAELARLECGLAQPSGARPACKPELKVEWHIERPHAPSLRLWQAAAAPAATAEDIANSLAKTQQSLMDDAHAQRWGKLFLINEWRGQDLLAAGGSTPGVMGQMADLFAKAAASHPGLVTSAPPPSAAALRITRLPANLLLVTRLDGMPLFHIQIGGAANTAIDPADSGDEADRFVTGLFELNQAIYGNYEGKWRLIR